MSIAVFERSPHQVAHPFTSMAVLTQG